MKFFTVAAILFIPVALTFGSLFLSYISSPVPLSVEGGYYSTVGMISYVVPGETAELATAFRQNHPGELAWDNRAAYDVVVAWLNTLMLQYKEDPEINGRHDLWRSPSNTIENEGGDCEDFAILVGSFLRELGCPNSMFLVLVRVSNGLHIYLSINGLPRGPLVINSHPYYSTYSPNGEVLAEALIP